jgi:hypothetical protein
MLQNRAIWESGELTQGAPNVIGGGKSCESFWPKIVDLIFLCVKLHWKAYFDHPFLPYLKTICTILYLSHSYEYFLSIL